MILVDTLPLYRQITLNRPDRLNALLPEMADAMISALDDAQADESCRAVLLTGAGRGFCAGQDLTAIVDADPDDIADLLDSYHPVIEKIRELPLPVVAAVNGVAAGAGCNLALACDIVIAARSASFVQAFSRIGLVPDCGGTWFLPRLIGTARARALMMLAEPLPADTAAEWGMIWRVVDDDRLMQEAQALDGASRVRPDRRARADQTGARRKRRQRSRRPARSRARPADRGGRNPGPCRRRARLSRKARAGLHRPPRLTALAGLCPKSRNCRPRNEAGF